MVKYPSMRQEIIDTLKILADVDYQRRAWVHRQFPSGIQYDDFDTAVHVLFDDSHLADAPEKAIGWILEDEVEVQAIRPVIQAVDNILNQLGTEISDEEYINSAQWGEVVKFASEALMVFDRKTA